MKKKVITTVVIIINTLVVLATVLILLWQNGVLLLNNPKNYEVKGIDVSQYQGEIDWEILAKEGIEFAFIKATEGSQMTDCYFLENYQNAKKTNLKLGAYHFFSFESSGIEQAKNYINTVNKVGTNEIFVPIVDIEFYQKERNKTIEEVQKIKKELKTFLEKVEEQYHIKPIIYTTQKSYQAFEISDFLEYDLWIRNVFSIPKLKTGHNWCFWQYSDKGKLQGYQGQERFIDLNVFDGTKEEFNVYWKEKIVKRKEQIEKENQKKVTIKGIVEKIEGNIIYIQNKDLETKRVFVDEKKMILNNRTRKEIHLEQINEQDKIEITNILKESTTKESEITVTKNLKGEELKKELLSSNEISMTIKKLTKNGDNTIVTGDISDYYSDNSQAVFEISIIVNEKTKIFSETKKQYEWLQEMEQRGDIIYVKLLEAEMQKGELVASNIEILGC